MSAWLYGAERVADVVEQRAHDVLVVLAAAVGPRRRLQRVLEPVDGEPAGVPVEQAQVGEHAVGEPGGELEVVVGDHAPVLGRALGHGVERRSSSVRRVGRHASPRSSNEPTLYPDRRSVRQTWSHAAHPVRRHPRAVPGRVPLVPRARGRPAPRALGAPRGSSTASCSRSAGASGFLGMEVPEEYGGGGVERLPVQRRHRRGAPARRRQRRRARPHAAQRHLPAVLPAPDRRRAEGSGGCRASAPAS